MHVWRINYFTPCQVEETFFFQRLKGTVGLVQTQVIGCFAKDWNTGIELITDSGELFANDGAKVGQTHLLVVTDEFLSRLKFNEQKLTSCSGSGGGRGGAQPLGTFRDSFGNFR